MTCLYRKYDEDGFFLGRRKEALGAEIGFCGAEVVGIRATFRAAHFPERHMNFNFMGGGCSIWALGFEGVGGLCVSCRNESKTLTASVPAAEFWLCSANYFGTESLTECAPINPGAGSITPR